MQKQKKSKYYKVLLLTAAVFIVAIGVGTVVFWRYIEAYELSRHEHAIQYLRENIDYDFWERSVESAMIPLLTVFESDVGAPVERHLHKIRDVQYSFRQKTDESSAQAPIYIIRAGPKDIGIVRLVPTVDVGFGFNLWEVGSIELLDSFVESLAENVSVTVSQNATVEVNGVPLEQEFLTECEFEYGAAYLLQGIFGEVEVSVFEFDGRKSEPYFAQNGEFYFPIINPFTRTFNILVPEGADVFIDGEKVSPGHISVRWLMPEVFDGGLSMSDIPFTMFRYEFEQSGFYVEPVVTAVDRSGSELVPIETGGGEILFTTPFCPELKERHTATVETFIRAFVNFSTNIGENTGGNYGNVSRLMLRGTELQRRTQGATTTLSWLRNSRIRYNSLEIDNFRPFGDDHFTCEVRYNINHRTEYQTRDVDGHFEILFVRSGGNWLAAKMIAI